MLPCNHLQYQTPLAIGIFLGIVSTLSMQHLLLSAIFASESLTDDIVSHLSNGNIRRLLESVMQDDQEHGDDVAFSVFSFFLFVLFVSFHPRARISANSARTFWVPGHVLYSSRRLQETFVQIRCTIHPFELTHFRTCLKFALSCLQTHCHPKQ